MIRRSPPSTKALRDAIRTGKKTQTRWPIKPDPKRVLAQYADGSILTARLFKGDDQTIKPPYGVPGDVWAMAEPIKSANPRACQCVMTRAVYSDDGAFVMIDGEKAWYPPHWKLNAVTSSQMPTWAARDFKLITDVRIERVQDISEADAVAEGFSPKVCESFFRKAPGWTEPGATCWVESEDHEELNDGFLCEECANKLQRKHKGSYLNMDSAPENDGPADCDKCGKPLYMSLTHYGIDRELMMEDDPEGKHPEYYPASGLDASIAWMIAGGIGDLQEKHLGRLAQIGFATAIDQCYSKDGLNWADNPWVWAYTVRDASAAEVEKTT